MIKLFDVCCFKIKFGDLKTRGEHVVKTYPRMHKAGAVKKGSEMLEKGFTVNLVEIDQADYP